MTQPSHDFPNTGDRVAEWRTGVRRLGRVCYADRLQVLVKWDEGGSSSLGNGERGATRGNGPCGTLTIPSDVNVWGEKMPSLEPRHYQVRLQQSRRLRYRVLRGVLRPVFGATRIVMTVVRLPGATIRASANRKNAWQQEERF